MHRFFDGWPSRREAYETIQREKRLPIHSLIEHVSSRWLTLEPAAQRVLEQMDALDEYFLRYLPKKNSKLAQKKACQSITQFLKKPTRRAELQFVISSARMFTQFTGLFQRDEPLVHVLYTELEKLMKIIMGRVCKSGAIKDIGLKVEVFDKDNLIPLKNFICADEVTTELSQEKVSSLLTMEVRVLRC